MRTNTLTKEHIKLMRQCIGFHISAILGFKFKAKRNCFYYYRCDLEKSKLWNDLCKMGYAKYNVPFGNRQPFYTLTEKGINFLEKKYTVQISV
ncbi:hypothetical protein IKA92_01945 [bacterium]|nr:hypothetical protein [bacterium]